MKAKRLNFLSDTSSSENYLIFTKIFSFAKTKDEDGAFVSSVMRQFSRKWTLPPSCDLDKVQSNLSSDGILMVTCPKENSALGHESQKAIKN